MPGQFSITWPKRRGPSDPWFRVGTVDVTTTTFVVGLSVISFFVYALDKNILRWLQFWPEDVIHGQIWRLVTWPLLNEPDIWTAFSIFLLWWFGNQLENNLGRVRFAKFLLGCTVIPAVVATAYFYVAGGFTGSNVGSLLLINGQAIRLLELAVFVAYVAERPHARFFFGIPAWVLAAVFIGMDVLRYLGDRLFLALVFELAMAGVALLALRAFGFGQAVAWVPLVRLPPAMGGPGVATSRRSSPKPAKKKASKGGAAPVVGPWPGSTVVASQQEVDRILDKIASSGMNSLTESEKAQLEAASRARREKKA